MIDIITGPANHGHMIAGRKNTMHMIVHSIVYGYAVAVILCLQDVQHKEANYTRVWVCSVECHNLWLKTG